MQRVHDYIEAVQSGTIVTCDEVKLAVQRHLNDLKRKDVFFHEESAQYALDFFKFLNLRSNPNDFVAFELQPFQAFIVAMLFGWLRTHSGKRKYNRAYIEIARKNGKTFFAAGISILLMLVDGEDKPEVYVGANSKQQARICFEDAKTMVEASPSLTPYVTCRQFHMESKIPTKSKYRYVSADSSKHDGLRPHGVVLDEIHEFKTNALYNIFASAMGNRTQPLILMITTAGFNKTYWCYREQRSFVLQVLKKEVIADNVFGIIYTLDKGDDWKDPKVWIKANPNLGVSVNEEYLAQEVHTAIVKPSDRVGILTKNFNIWMDAEQIWIPAEIWDNAEKKMTYQELKGAACYGGADLSVVEDITAVSFLFELPDGTKHIIHKFFVPLDTARRRQEATGIPYLDWIRDGHLIGTEGNVIDYNVVKAHILNDWDLYGFNTMGFDRHNANHIMQEINAVVPQLLVKIRDSNFEKIDRCYGMTVNTKSISPSAKEFVRLLYSGELTHDGNPVMAWMLGNVQIKQDEAGIRPDKAKSKDKIDGVYSTLLSIEQSMFWSDKEIRQQSIYHGRKALIL